MKPKYKLVNLFYQRNPALATLWQKQRRLTPKRFRKLADFLETLPMENFSMCYWMYKKHDCGTKGCIGGWATTLPFATRGKVKLFLHRWSSHKSEDTFETMSASIPPKYMGLRTTVPRLEEEDSLLMFFGLHLEEVEHIFFNYTQSKNQAIRTLRKYANDIEEEGKSKPKGRPKYGW